MFKNWWGGWRARRGVAKDAGRGSAADSPAEASAPMVQAVLAELQGARSRVQGRTQRIQNLTEKEILACGGVLSEIVQGVSGYIGVTQEEMAQSTRQYQSLSDQFSELGQRMDIELQAQQQAVQHLLGLAQGIEKSIGAINGLNLMAHLLSLNARIEAAHLGERGRAFTAISERMSELSDTIGESARAVVDIVGEFRTALPPINERAQSLRRHTNDFIQAAEEHSGQMGGSHEPGTVAPQLSALMDLSNQALSHLQFQDPMVQEVHAIPRAMEQLEERIRHLLDGGGALDPIEDEPEPAAGGQEAGAMMMF